MTRYLGVAVFAVAVVWTVMSAPEQPTRAPGYAGEASRATLAPRGAVAAVRAEIVLQPTPTPPTAAPTPQQAGVVAVIRAAAREFGQDADALVTVATCESSLRPDALGKAGERGIFQFWPPTWAWYSHRLDYTEADAWDVTAQARLAALAWSEGHRGWWTC